MFKCPSCGSEATTLIAGSLGVGCHMCVKSVRRTSVNLHNNGGLSGDAKNLTEADKKHFLNRDIGRDGKTCVCKDNPNKRWRF